MINKIFFWDGRLDYAEKLRTPLQQIEGMQDTDSVHFITIDAAWGVSNCLERLKIAQGSDINHYILTNFLQALDANWINTVLFANDPVHRIQEMFYLWGGVRWVPLEKLTDKELRYAHNLAKMYLVGSFNPFL